MASIAAQWYCNKQHHADTQVDSRQLSQSLGKVLQKGLVTFNKQIMIQEVTHKQHNLNCRHDSIAT